MKLSSVVLQFAALVAAAVFGSANAQSGMPCTVQVTAAGTGNAAFCTEAESCFSSAISIQYVSGSNYFITPTTACQTLLGNRVDLSVNAAGTELSGRSGAYTLSMTGTTTGYQVVLSDGSRTCTAPLTRTMGTACPVSQPSAPSAGSRFSTAAAGASVALAAVAAGLVSL